MGFGRPSRPVSSRLKGKREKTAFPLPGQEENANKEQEYLFRFSGNNFFFFWAGALGLPKAILGVSQAALFLGQTKFT